MAAKKDGFSKVEIDFVLGNGNCNENKATLVIECIKYLLYERHQLPATVDQILRSSEAESAENPKNAKRADIKKRTQLLKDLKCLFQNLQELFMSTSVCSALLIFGSTAVSPKESYEIQFSSSTNSISDPFYSPTVEFNSNRISRKFLRKLVMNEKLREFKEIPSTPLLVFVQVPRSAQTTWFRPKLSFKVPWKSNYCQIRVKDEEFSNDTTSEQDLVWLQAPVPIKGYYEKSKDVTNVFSEFWE